jgi:hypothetical protein
VDDDLAAGFAGFGAPAKTCSNARFALLAMAFEV